jgi:uncharacterized RDD family membrane protein YckC
MSENISIEPQETTKLASLSDRLFASLVDGFIMALIILVPLIIIYGIDGWLELPSQYGILYTVIMFAIGQVVFLIVQGRLLFKYGQTIGKRYLEIKITDLNGNLPPFGIIYGIRYISMSIFPMIPLLGGLLSLADILCIFRKDRRCVHDLIAGTKVIAA